MRFKRFFAILVSLIMVVSLVPASAFAEDMPIYGGSDGTAPSAANTVKGRLNVTYYDSENNNSTIGTQVIEITDVNTEITKDNLNFDKNKYEISTEKTFGYYAGNKVYLRSYWWYGSQVFYFAGEYGDSLSANHSSTTPVNDYVSVYLREKDKKVSADQWASFFVIKPDVQDMSVSAGANFYSVGWGKINQRTEKSTLNGATEQDILDLIDSAPSITDSWSKKSTAVVLCQANLKTAQSGSLFGTEL